MKFLKCLIINSVCGIRSTGRICVDIAEKLIDRGNVVKIAYGRENVPEEYKKYSVHIGTDIDVKIHGLVARFFDATGFGSKTKTRKFVEWIKDYDPDIIHIHNLHGYYINIEILFDYLRQSGKKIIWTLHDCWSFTGHCPYFEFVKCDKWMNGCGRCPQIKEYPKSYLDFSERNWRKKKAAFTGVKDMVLVTPSQWLASLTKKSFMREYTVKVIHNSVDTDIFKPLKSGIKQEYGLGDKKVVLGVASEWNYRKGFDYMVKLAEKLGNNYVVVVIGITKEQKKVLLPNMLGLPRTANIQELVKWYSVAEVFVNPTLEDNYPTTNLEAIACGTPVLTFDSGGSAESAKLYGEAVSKGDIDSICEMILTGKFKDYQLNRTDDDMILQYLSLYKEMTKDIK